MYELTYNLFVTPRYQPTNTRAQNINTIDEVPDSSWFTNRIGAAPLSADADRARAAGRCAAGAGKVGDPAREVRRRQSRLHRERCQRRDLVPRLRSAGRPGGRERRGRDRDQAVLGARLQPGRDVPHDVRSERGDDRSAGDRQAAVRRAHALHARRHAPGARSRRAQRRRHLPRRGRPRCCRARSSAGFATPARGPTIPTTSCRTSIAASCARCACSAPGPT